ncbi:amino acid adenylation domain-containing protein (plasmid) [Streptomyces decoyicus]|uniref:amino acid adenylation domain-containing protein n=1 Tax=Streptomyces decoyicus TaxID=249567 RepID=UPI002E3164C4|nr:amino acid adenylation domain-containing protein [Streptomyces decoyicus]
MTNPFEVTDRACLVLTDDEGRHSLWPATAAPPDGWKVVYGPYRRQVCLDYIGTHWTGMAPRSPGKAATEPSTEPPGSEPPGSGDPLASFEAWAVRTPDAVAVIAGDTRWTYGELNARADAVAHDLVARGVGPEDLVALLMPRSAELVVALFAALKSGAGYVPIDPEYPADRIAHVLADAAPRVVLTTDDPVARRAADVMAADRERLVVPAARSAEGAAGPAAPVRAARPAHPAYVIYTSGSTGRPKGVVVPRAALVNFLAAMDELFSLAPADRLVAVTTPAFDIAALEIYLPLSSGARVVLASHDTTRDPSALAELVTRSGATVLQATPSLWQALVTQAPEAVRGLRMLVGGEALPTALGERMRALGRRVTNLYGPTEATIWSTAQDVDGSAAPASIGRPVRNTRVCVLDDELRPVPAGVAGELYLAGEGLARGYLNRPGLTAQRFVADPSGPRGTRMYRTGDLARWGRGGTLEYLSRVDLQVKVRGFRVELGEIETVVGRNDGVAQAVVTVREDHPGDARLVCHVVPAPGHCVDPVALRAFAGRFLPEYMVPSAVTVWSSFPLTPNGKVDRGALAASPVAGGPAAPGEAAIARDDTVLGAVARAWQYATGEPTRSGRSFAELGGTSLGASRAAARIRELTGRSATVADVLRAASAEELAATVAAAPPHVDRSGQDAGRTSAPLSPCQRAIWAHGQLAGEPLLYTETYCLALGAGVDVRRLADAVRKAALRHPAVGAAVESRDGEPWLLLGRHRVALTVRTLPAGLGTPDAITLARREAARPIRLDLGGPLLRAVLFRTVGGEAVLLLAWHHLIMDGWGMRLFVADLVRFHNEPDAVPEPGRVTLCDLNTWANRAEAAPGREQDLTAAAEELAPVLTAAYQEWPGRPGSQQPVHTVEFDVPGSLAREVDTAAAAAGHTAFVLICAAYRRALAAVLERERLVLAVAVAGRDQPESVDVVGCFLNTVLLDGSQQRSLTGQALLDHLRDAFDRAVASHGHLPFPRLVNKVRERVRLPMDFPHFYLSVDDVPEARFTGFEAHGLPAGPERAKFAVTASLLHGAGHLTGRLECRTDVLSAGGAAHLVKAFQSALTDIVADCGQAAA